MNQCSTVIVNKVSQKTVTVEEGARGPRGLSDLFFVTRVAASDLGGHRAVVANTDGTIDFASASNLQHLGKVLGIIEQAVVAGKKVNVIRGGLLEFEGFSWDINLPVYLAEDGHLSQTPSSTSFSQIVGFAESPTGLFVNLREPIQLF